MWSHDKAGKYDLSNQTEFNYTSCNVSVASLIPDFGASLKAVFIVLFLATWGQQNKLKTQH